MKRTPESTTLKVDTLVHRLHLYAQEQPEKIAYTFLRYSGGENESCTYRELDRQARCISAYLQKQGARGKPVLLLFPSGIAYIAAYFGCLYAGAIAVPAYLPHSERDLPRVQAIVEDSQAQIALTTMADFRRISRRLKDTDELACLTWVTTDSLIEQDVETWQEPDIDEDTLAFLQYTSGSTSTPRGVMVSHRNLMCNLAMIQNYWKMDEIANPVGVYWLPIFHDLGLILGILSPIYNNYPVYFMSPTDFLQRPLRWLQAISKYRATYSCAPNFAYELCVHRLTESEIQQLDLSHWIVAGNGAEPVRGETMVRFARYFASSGFALTAFRPAYGMAEATLAVSTSYVQEPLVIKSISKKRLEEGYVEDVSADDEATYSIVGCGQPRDGQQIVIVNPETLERCAPTHIGEIWVMGPNVTKGYWRRAEETAATFQAYLATGEGPFLRTGDLGIYIDENIFITGRSKDLIIINGRNLYPQDIEHTVEQVHPAIRTGNVVAFSLEQDGEERLIVLAEINHRYGRQEAGVDRASLLDEQEIIKSVRRAVADCHEVRVHQVQLLKMGGILKTSSGKLQRRACRQAFVQGTLKTWSN